MSHHQDDWVDWLPLAEFTYNNCIHSATHHTPFKLDSGQHLWMGSEPTQSSAVETRDDSAHQMSQMQDEVKAALEHAVDEMAWYYDCQRSPTLVYEVRAKVWLNAQNYTTTHCRWDNGSVCVLPIYASFGPQNITVIMSQESHYWNAFLIGFTKTHFLHPPNYGYWDVLYTVGKV